MRRVIYTIKATNYSTTNYDFVKNFPEHTYTVRLEEIKPEETEKQRELRLARIKRRQQAIALLAR